MVHPDFQSYLPLVRKVFEKYNVANAYIFGSVLSERFNDNSDIDLLINFTVYSNPLKIGQSIWDMEEELENLTRRKVDLITERALRNPYFIQELNNTKLLIYDNRTA